MLRSVQIKDLFKKLNEQLRELEEIGEIGIVGGAVMCLVYNARAATKDVDAIFEPSQIIRKVAAQIAINEGLPIDWLNDAVKSYIKPGFIREEVLLFSHLKIWAPEARYMLAMKCISARFDTSDGDDIRFLIQHLSLSKSSEVFEIIENYYPKNQIEAKTQFFIEELFEI
ncbi:MAG: hypothetical protein HOJ35_07145 [Bdellovibrionales bacterium]|nr:hypothetical protein [Bdellovibrionales bacterium]